MELDYLKEFLTFSECMSVSEAARQLHMSQSALSNHIAALEKAFSVQLVDRSSPTALSLTSPGRLLVSRSFELIGVVDSIVEELRRVDQGQLDLTIALDKTSTAPHRTLIARCYQMCAENHSMFVHYQESRDSTAANALRDGSVDCVAVYVCPIPSDLDAGVAYRRIPSFYPNRLVVSIDKRNPLSKYESLRWEDLSGMTLPVSDGYFKLWANATRALVESRVSNVAIVPNALEVHSFLRSLGVNDFQLYDESCADVLLLGLDKRRVLIPLDEPDAFSECFIAYYPNRISPALKALLEYLDTIEG